jgi:hypothetical protein
MNMTRTISALLAVSTLLAAVPMSASADRYPQPQPPRGDWGGKDWHGRDIRYFHDRDLPRWRSGHWHHGYHDGRLGWWWIVAGLWYFYPQRVADYPDPYTPPPVVVVQQTAPAPSTAPPPSQYWYYCAPEKGYYPYVPSCPGGWTMVPALPPGAPGQ